MQIAVIYFPQSVPWGFPFDLYEGHTYVHIKIFHKITHQFANYVFRRKNDTKAKIGFSLAFMKAKLDLCIGLKTILPKYFVKWFINLLTVIFSQNTHSFMAKIGLLLTFRGL